MDNKEWLCVCQSKNGKTGICDVIPKYQEELNELKSEINITDYALSLACEHIAKENTLIFSLVGKGLKRIIRDEFIRKAKMELEVKHMTEAKKVSKDNENE